MKKLLLSAFASMALLCFSTGAWADRVSEVFECELEKGKTLADAQEVNKKWLAFMHANVSEDITSVAATVLVGKSKEFPAGNAALETDKGKAVVSGFEDVIECDENKLYRLRAPE